MELGQYCPTFSSLYTVSFVQNFPGKVITTSSQDLLVLVELFDTVVGHSVYGNDCWIEVTKNRVLTVEGSSVLVCPDCTCCLKAKFRGNILQCVESLYTLLSITTRSPWSFTFAPVDLACVATARMSALRVLMSYGRSSFTNKFLGLSFMLR